MRLITVCLLVLSLKAVAEEAGGYGFGKILTLGPHDKLVMNESLRVLSADTVGFVYYQQGRKLSGRLDDPANPLAEGDELGFQIFYLSTDSEEARKQDRQFGDLLGIQQARQGGETTN